MKAAGFNAVAAMDNDGSAIHNYRRNIHASAWRVDLSRELPQPRMLNNVDVVVAGPPCQGFSTVGRRRIDDQRNDLLPLTAELALRLRAKVVVVENVTGSIAGEHQRFWRELEGLLRLRGYRTNAILCRADCIGMAQKRRRVLLFAWNTARESSFTIPSLGPATLRRALRGVGRLPNHEPMVLQPGSRARIIADRIRPGQKLSNVRGGKRAVPTWEIPEVFGVITENERTLLELLRRLRRQSRARTDGDADPVSLERLSNAFGVPFLNLLRSLQRKGYVRCLGDHYDLANTFNGTYRRLAWDEPSYTVDTRFGSPRHFLHPTHPRGFTVREAARIQGFPDSYTFYGDCKTHYRLIGNAVPPPIGRLVGNIARHLLTGL